MKCEIRTVINLDDEDLINLIEKCKEKHKLAELIEKALVTYCYQSDKTPESKRIPSNDEEVVPEALSKELRSLAVQLAVISNNVQSNHSYVMEAIGRLGNAVEQRPVVVSAPSYAATEPVSGGVPAIHPVPEPGPSPMMSVGYTEDTVKEEEPKSVKVEEPEPVVEEKPKSVEKVVEEKVEEKPKASSSDDDDDEEGLSPEAAALMAQFFGG